jgi:hypothetical protein
VSQDFSKVGEEVNIMASKSDSARSSDTVVPRERRHFHALLAANPNYFGSIPNFGLAAQMEKKGDTTYEGLSCVSYSPERSRLEATVQVKLPYGYSGDLCSQGSFEHVRFYLSYDEGASWTDCGVTSINVHDIPARESCDASLWHPISYVCGIDVQPKRNWCALPVLPLVRAILSWQIVPDPGMPDQVPIWGEMRECHVQVKPRRIFIGDLADHLDEKLKLKLPPTVLTEVPQPPIPDPGPLAALSLGELVELYGRSDKVPEHRFALPHLARAASAQGTGAMTLSAFVPAAEIAKASKIDLAKLLEVLEGEGGNRTYEELECVGLDNNAEQLVGTFRVKQASGYSGGPCTAGSTEYVAYWGDFGDECKYSYLGTVEVNTHDFDKLPKGGLCYAAPLPVNLGAFRRKCDTPVVGRVRAVLSWGTPPSTTDPDAMPYWGNRLDVHVQLAPGRPYDGTARFTIVGGIPATSVSTATGLTLSGAALAVNGSPVGAGAAFGGVVTLHGPLDPALAGQLYRIRVRNVTASGPVTDLVSPFFVVDSNGVGSWQTPGAGGWAVWPGWWANTTGKLGHFTPGGEDLWEVRLEVFGSGTVDTRLVQADNTLNAALVTGDANNAADLELDTMGACRFAGGLLGGTFVARDTHFLAWGLGVAGGPYAPGTMPPTPVDTGPGFTSADQTALSGHWFTIDLSQLDPCGYVVALTISDRVVASSASFPRSVRIEKGVCLE